MAETIRIEIPIEAKDNTGAAVSAIQGRLTGLERSLQRMERMFSRMGKSQVFDLEAHDAASQVITQTEDRLAGLNGTHATVSMQVDDAVTNAADEASDAVAALDGEEATVSAQMDDGATGPLGDVQDAVAALNGEGATVEASAEDNATGPLGSVQDAVSALNGSGAVVEVSVADMATDVLNGIIDLTNALNGATAAISVTVDDSALSTLLEIQDVVESLNGSSVSIGAAGGGGGSGGSLDLSGGNTVQGAASSAAGNISGAIAGAAGFAGLSFGLGGALGSFQSFEYTMSQVEAISGATAQQMEMLTSKAQEMGATTAWSATQAAEAFTYMAMAGWKPEQMMAGIAPIMNLASASGESLGSTADIVTDALTAFGYTAEDTAHFADVLATAASNSNTNVGMLGESFKYAAPLAGAMGYSAEDVGIALGIMANSGIKASMAGTALRRAISNLANPSDAVATAMDKYNISLTDNEGNVKSLGDLMGDLRENLGGLDEAEQAAAVSTLFGTNALSGMMAIINASDKDFNALTAAIYDAEGATDRMAATMLDNMQGSLVLLQSAFEGTQNVLGSRMAPYVRELADGMAEVMPLVSQGINDWFDTIDSGLDGKLSGLADALKTNLANMLNSEEWANADGIEKIDIAWDSLIGGPLTEWAGGEGTNLVGNAVRGMFESAGKVISGEGGITDWIGTAALVKGTESIIGSLSGLGGAVDGALATLASMSSGFSLTAGAVVAAAAGIAVGIYAITAAVQSYNAEMDALATAENLADHFGSLELSDDQVIDLAGKVVNADGIIAKLHASEVHFDNAEELVSQAETELAGIEYLTWKVQRFSLEMGNTDWSDLQSSAQQIQEKLKGAMEENRMGANEFLNAVMPSGEAGGLTTQIDEWFRQDEQKLTVMGDTISQLIQESIEKGVMDVDTSAAISILQGKMMDLVTGAQTGNLLGELDWLSMRNSGAALTSDSWASYVNAVGGKLEEYSDAMGPNAKKLFGQLEQLKLNDPGRTEEIDSMIGSIQRAIAGADASYVGAAASRLYGDLDDAYGSEISAARSVLENNVMGDVMGMFSTGNMGAMTDIVGGYTKQMKKAIESETGSAGKATLNAFADRFMNSEAIVSSLEKTIDQSEGPVSAAVKDAYDRFIEIGAMGGDKAASQQYAANQLADVFMDPEAFRTAMAGRMDEMEIDSMLSENGAGLGLFKAWLGGDEQYEALAEDQKTAFERAFKETISEADYDSMMKELNDGLANGIDLNDLMGIFKSYGYNFGPETFDASGAIEMAQDAVDSFMDAVSGTESTMSVDGDNIKLEVESQEIADKISEEYGKSLDDIASGKTVDAETGKITYNLGGDSVEFNDDMLTQAVEEQFGKSIEEAVAAIQNNASDFEIDLDAGTMSITMSQFDETGIASLSDALGMEIENVKSAFETAMQNEDGSITAELSIGDVNIQGGAEALAAEAAEGAFEDLGDPVEMSVNANAEPGEITGIDESKSQFDQEAQSAFNEPANTTGTQITASAAYGGDNGTIANAYGDFKAAAQSAFNTPVPVNATIVVNASSSFGGIGLGGRAEGGFIGSPELSWVGEDGPEYIIPVGAKRKGQGLELWEQAGMALGAFDDIGGYADGGLVGGSVLPPMPSRSSSTPDYGGILDYVRPARESGDSGSTSSGSPANITVNLSPSFNVGGGESGSNNTVDEIRRMLLGLTDDLAGEIARNMADVYSNTPVRQG